MTFANPLCLLLLLLLIPYVLWHFLLQRGHEPTLRIASTDSLRQMPGTLRTRLIHLPFLLRIISFSLLVIVLARPQTSNALRSSETEGIDIMMAMDISTSMMAQDVRPNRLTVAKEVAYDFISNRPNDNIGLMLFGGEAFSQCPLTTDHKTLLGMFRSVTCDWQAQGIIAPGTAIGMGIASSVAHLERSKAKSKVVILLTDGENNAGDISPLTAADIAKKCGVRVYTILLGVDGSKQKVPVAQLPDGEVYQASVETHNSPATLQEIAQTTGGVFYQASTKKGLQEIYQDIDRLEKTKLRVQNYDRRYEAYAPFALGACIALLLELLLGITWFRRMP